MENVPKIEMAQEAAEMNTESKIDFELQSCESEQIWEKPKRSRLSHAEWGKVCSFFDPNGSLKNGCEDQLTEFLTAMSQKYCSQKEYECKCPVCGNKKSPIHALCLSCELDFFAKKHIRVFRGSNHKGEMCLICGKRKATLKGVCRPCYRRSYNRYDTAEKSRIKEIERNANKEKSSQNIPQEATFKKVQW